MTAPRNSRRRHVIKEAELTRIRVQLPTLFVPGAPIQDIVLLQGRSYQIGQVISAVAQVGQHAIIYGERSVGKTSLASLVHLIWTEYLKDADIVSARVQCDPSDTYATIWQKVTEALQRDFEKRGLHPLGNGRFDECAALIEAGGANPTRITSLFDLAGKKAIVVIDEFDVVEDNETAGLMASTIKQLSDFIIDATLVIAGVADSVDQLIAEHASIDRCLKQVFMPRMSVAELSLIVETRLQRVGMNIHPRALLRIAALSQGFPFYTHLLGLHAALAAVDRGSLTIEPNDVDSAIKAAIFESQESILSDYLKAVTSPRPENLYRQTLLACALTKADEAGYFAPADVRAPISRVMNKNRDVSTYMKQINAFATQERGKILEADGDTRNRRFRFDNPLLKPFVILHGIDDQLISEQDAYLFSQPDVAEQLKLNLL